MRRLTHVEVAAAIGVSPVQVSRIRLGQQAPSIDTMKNIFEQYAWSLGDQVYVLAYGNRKKYAEAFETILRKVANQ